MPRKAKRIKRNPITHRNPIYFDLVARQLATQKQQSWFDILPEDIKIIIWKEYYKAPLLQIKEFGMFRAIIQIYIRNHIYKNDYDDIKYSRNGKYMVLRYSTNKDHYSIETSECSTYSLHNSIISLFSSYDTITKKRIYYKIFDESIVPNIKYLYGLCKLVPDNWDYIGRAEDIVAGKFTYN